MDELVICDLVGYFDVVYILGFMVFGLWVLVGLGFGFLGLVFCGCCFRVGWVRAVWSGFGVGSGLVGCMSLFGGGWVLCVVCGFGVIVVCLFVGWMLRLVFEGL